MQIRSLSKEFAGEEGLPMPDILTLDFGKDHPVTLSVRKGTADNLSKFKLPIQETNAESKSQRTTFKLDAEMSKDFYIVNLEGNPKGLWRIGLKDVVKTRAHPKKLAVHFVKDVAQNILSEEKCKEFGVSNGYLLSEMLRKELFPEGHSTTEAMSIGVVYFAALFKKIEDKFEFLGVFMINVSKGRDRFIKDNKPHLLLSKMQQNRAYPLNVVGGIVPGNTYTYSSIDTTVFENIPNEVLNYVVPYWNEFMTYYLEWQESLQNRFFKHIINNSGDKFTKVEKEVSQVSTDLDKSIEDYLEDTIPQ